MRTLLLIPALLIAYASTMLLVTLAFTALLEDGQCAMGSDAIRCIYASSEGAVANSVAITHRQHLTGFDFIDDGDDPND